MGGLQDDSWTVVVMNSDGDEVSGGDEVGGGEVSSTLN
jgi:hypothetical protein